MLVVFLSSCSEEDNSLPNDPITLTFSTEDPIILDSPSLNSLTGLSTEYVEYYSGYWKGSLCGGNEEAIIGINDDTVELNTNAYFMKPMFGTIDSLGALVFPTRQVNWDTEIYGEVRPLTISGVIDRASKTGYIDFEVACSRYPLEFTISTITVHLKIGPSQPSPDNELHRIQSEAINLIGSSIQSCSEETHCKAFNIDTSKTFCNLTAIPYSTIDTDEDILTGMQNEYTRNRWLASSSISSSSTSYCGRFFHAVCESNICVMR